MRSLLAAALLVSSCGNQQPAFDPTCLPDGRCNPVCPAPDPDCAALGVPPVGVPPVGVPPVGVPPIGVAPVAPPVPTPMPMPVPAPLPPAAVVCGAEGQPFCPLQGFMKTTMGPAAQGGGEPLALALQRAAALAPDETWNAGPAGWRAIAEAGAAAARAGNPAGAQAACKACHGAWRDRYRAEHRTRPLPP